MSNQLSDADANNQLDVILSHSASSFPTTWHFALLTTAPSDSIGTGIVEVTGAGYARVAMAANLTNFAAAAARSKTNAFNLAWPTATADWAAGSDYVVGVGLYDAATAGVFRGYGDLGTPVHVLIGGAPLILAGAFTMTA